MNLLSLDELLEQVVRALYKKWYAPDLGADRATIDALRGDLVDALRAAQNDALRAPELEDAMLEFLQGLAALSPVQTLAGDELQRLPALRTGLLRSRQPNAPSVRGAPIKRTDASAPRLQQLEALLGAAEPAVYVLSTMYYRERTPATFLGSTSSAPENELLRTLATVLEQLARHWGELPLDVQGQVLQEVDRLGTFDASAAKVEKSVVREVLAALEKLPDVLRVALDPFVAGKSDTPPGTYRSGTVGDELPAGARLLSAVASLYSADTSSALESFAKSATLSPPEASGREASLPEASLPEGAGDEHAVGFHSQVDFPGQVAPGSETPLVVQLVLPRSDADPVDVTLPFADPKQPEIVEVVLTTQNFRERTGDWTRLIKVFSEKDSQPAVFLLRADAVPGTSVITVDYYHWGRLVGSAKYEVAITDQPAADPGSIRRIGESTPLEPLPGDPPAPADLELRVIKEPQSNTLHFTLHSEDASLGYNRREMGSVPLADNPRQFLSATFHRLSTFAAQATAGGDEAFLREMRAEITTIGEGLFEKIFPQALQEEYWHLKELRAAGRIRTLLIVSDEPWIPWELVKPFTFDRETNEEFEDDFLCRAFRMSRWLSHRGLGEHINIRAMELVAPNLDLLYVQRERDYFQRLTQSGLRLGEILRTRQDFLETTSRGEFQLMHVAAHGKFQAENADAAPIILHNRETVLPSDLAGRRSLALRRQRPLVFLNTCHSGQIGFTLTGLGGWAECMVNDIGVNGFVGTLWEVHDQLAAEFAQMFYNKLRENQTLGEAFHAAREHIRTLQPANPTWLAYTLYGDPNSRVRWGDS